LFLNNLILATSFIYTLYMGEKGGKREKLSLNQRKALGEFCANFAVAWLAGGIVGPYISGQITEKAISTAVTSIIWATVLLGIMLYSTKGGEK